MPTEAEIDAEVERIQNLSDEDLIAEMIADGEDLELIEMKMRALFDLALANATLLMTRGGK